MEFYTTVDDELYEELCELVGEKVVYFEVWEDSLADELASNAEAQPADAGSSFDMDIYLEGGIYFQLYSAALFPGLDAEPVQGEENVRKELAELTRKGLILNEIAVDEEEGLVLIFTPQNDAKVKASFYISVGGWLLEEWDELPD